MHSPLLCHPPADAWLSLQTEYARLENSRFVYRIHRSPMCEYMINFIHKLKHLPEKYMMNSVLENFTILQVFTLPRALCMDQMVGHVILAMDCCKGPCELPQLWTPSGGATNKAAVPECMQPTGW